ncbi:ZIP family metal transporter [Bacillaceae bacterium S4-13-58]
MWNALLWGTIAGSATMLGALVVLKYSIPKKIIGYIMALGTGALIGATSYELLEDAVSRSGFFQIAIGFLGGSLIFTFLDIVISRKGGHKRKHSNRDEFVEENSEETSNVGVFIGSVMDTLPESAMIGMSLVGGKSVSIALVVSIFISNIPEGISSTAGLKKSGYSNKKIIVMWALVLFFSALSSLAGAMLLDSASDTIKAMVSSFTAGAIISMIASTMMPEAFKDGGPIVGFITCVGVFTSLVLHHS